MAEAIARSGASIKHRGRRRIVRDIEAAGIAESQARQAVDRVFGDLDDEAWIAQALDRRLRHGRAIADGREFERLYRHLLRQGFDVDRALKALNARR